MAKVIYDPKARHDDIPDGVLETLAWENAHAERANNHDQARRLKADVILKHVEARAMGNIVGWLMYDLTREEVGSVATVDQPGLDQVLMFMSRPPLTSGQIFIKMLRQQIIETEVEGFAIVTNEVMLDGQDACAHAVWGSLINPEIGIADSNYPWFRFEEGDGIKVGKPALDSRPTSYIVKANEFSDLLPLWEDRFGMDLRQVDDAVVPGLPTISSDKAYSLAKAQEMYDAISDCTPTHQYRPDQHEGNN